MTASDIDRARQQSIGDLLRRTALRYPDKTAVVYGDLCQTYVDLDDTVNRCANALAARGVAGGDRIALFSHNNHAFVVLYFALARLGAVSVPVNFMLSADEVRYVLDYSGATGLVTEDALLPVATRAAGDAVRVRAVIPGGDADVPDGWESVVDWLAFPDATPVSAPLAEDDLAQLIYNSGTESRPKGAMLSHRSLISQYVPCVWWTARWPPTTSRCTRCRCTTGATALLPHTRHLPRCHQRRPPRRRPGPDAGDDRGGTCDKAVLPADGVDLPAAPPRLRPP